MHYESINGPERRGPCAFCTGGRLRWCGFFLLVVGAVLLGLGTWLPSAIDSAITDGIRKQVILTAEGMEKNDDTFRLWQDTTQEDSSAEYYYIRALNITNPEEVLKGAKPIVVEVGPYVYRDFQKRFNVTFGRDRDQKKIVSFRKWEWYRFERHLTDPSLDPERDIFVSPNMVFQGLLAQLGGIGVSLFYRKYPEVDRLFVKRPLHELVWGYTDPVLEEIHKVQPTISPFFDGLLGNTTSLEKALEAMPHPHSMYTGEDYLFLTRQFYRYHGAASLECNGKPAWGTPEANRVYGTDGTQFAPGLEKNSTVTTWVDSVKREVPLYNRDGETVTIKGVELLRFRLPKQFAMNETTNPDNKAYYMKYTGLINITTCAPYHIPIFTSRPHFLSADPYIASKIEGLSADPEKHDLIVDVEPMTGITMHAAKRLQINILLKPVHIIGQEYWFKDLIPDLMCPSIWLEDGGSLTDSQASQFKDSLILAKGLKKTTPYIGYIVGTFLAFLGFFLAAHVARKRD